MFNWFKKILPSSTVTCPTCLGAKWAGHWYDCWACNATGVVDKKRTKEVPTQTRGTKIVNGEIEYCNIPTTMIVFREGMEKI